MDALTWFKSVFHRAQVKEWADVPLHVAAARLRPAPASDDENWDAVIVRAKLQAGPAKAPFPPRLPPPRHPSLKVPHPPPLPGPRHALPETVVTPPPVPAPPSRVKASGCASATLDAFIQRRSAFGRGPAGR
jgi:hypothetical protein